MRHREHVDYSQRSRTCTRSQYTPRLCTLLVVLSDLLRTQCRSTTRALVLAGLRGRRLRRATSEVRLKRKSQVRGRRASLIESERFPGNLAIGMIDLIAQTHRMKSSWGRPGQARSSCALRPREVLDRHIGSVLSSRFT